MVKKSNSLNKTGGEDLHDELFRELKHLRLITRDTAQNFILRREGNIEAILACLGTLPRKKISEKIPVWLREIRDLKPKPHKGRLKDLKVIDRLIKDLKSTLLDTQEKKVSVRGKKGKQPVAAEQSQKSRTPNQPVK